MSSTETPPKTETPATPAGPNNEGSGAPSTEVKPSPVAALKAKAAAILGRLKTIKKPAGSPVASVKLGVKSLIRGVFEIPLLILKGDLLTRLLALGFLASLILIIVAGAQLWHRFGPAIEIQARKAQTESGDSVTAYFQLQKELSIASDRLAFLERFTGTLQPSKYSQTARRKIPSFFEIEVWSECDEPETSRWIKARLPAAKEAVATVLQGRLYDRLLTDDGKNELQGDIVRSLNRWLAKANGPGKVKKVYFSRFMMQ